MVFALLLLKTSLPPQMGALLLIGTLLLMTLYFLPTILGRRKRNRGAIFALNLILGWTLIGWVGALVWALTVDEKRA
jgi:hypothetical protein